LDENFTCGGPWLEAERERAWLRTLVLARSGSFDQVYVCLDSSLPAGGGGDGKAAPMLAAPVWAASERALPPPPFRSRRLSRRDVGQWSNRIPASRPPGRRRRRLRLPPLLVTAAAPRLPTCVPRGPNRSPRSFTLLGGFSLIPVIRLRNFFFFPPTWLSSLKTPSSYVLGAAAVKRLSLFPERRSCSAVEDPLNLADVSQVMWRFDGGVEFGEGRSMNIMDEFVAMMYCC